MTAILGFGIEGVRIAGKIDQYNGYVWIPVLLILLSSSVCISVLFRMIRRYKDRFSF